MQNRVHRRHLQRAHRRNAFLYSVLVTLPASLVRFLPSAASVPTQALNRPSAIREANETVERCLKNGLGDWRCVVTSVSPRHHPRDKIGHWHWWRLKEAPKFQFPSVLEGPFTNEARCAYGEGDIPRTLGRHGGRGQAARFAAIAGQRFNPVMRSTIVGRQDKIRSALGQKHSKLTEMRTKEDSKVVESVSKY